MDPLYNNVVIGGINKKGSSEEPYYLATVDLYGTFFQEDIVATGDHRSLLSTTETVASLYEYHY